MADKNDPKIGENQETEETHEGPKKFSIPSRE